MRPMALITHSDADRTGNDPRVSRRFAAPWSARELEQAFRIEDTNGQAVPYTYFRRGENEARQASMLQAR